ncbi:hypothetical protein M0804_011679 [Polistes exclamans]|nr:hypothetical protein M0804_011679 [Polistes exclamans]
MVVVVVMVMGRKEGVAGVERNGQVE